MKRATKVYRCTGCGRSVKICRIMSCLKRTAGEIEPRRARKAKPAPMPIFRRPRPGSHPVKGADVYVREQAHSLLIALRGHYLRRMKEESLSNKELDSFAFWMARGPLCFEMEPSNVALMYGYVLAIAEALDVLVSELVTELGF